MPYEPIGLIIASISIVTIVLSARRFSLSSADHAGIFSNADAVQAEARPRFQRFYSEPYAE